MFADAYKCFDKLNLKDCICDISEIIGAEDAVELYMMNKVGKATIKTPIGLVENVEANNSQTRYNTRTQIVLCKHR